jgi:UDP-N-acetylglucosamine 2-epimerase (non-hydrolysing)
MNSIAKKWILVVGARPNFMKVAPLIRAIDKHNHSCDSSLVTIHYLLVHTGQHYDANMSDAFFRDLKLPEPDLHLGVGSGNHGEQTGKVLIEFEKVLLKEQPDLLVVVGDVNSTLACSLAAVKLHIPVAHVEAGLRSFDRKMPEEINRLLTDAVSDYLFTPSPEGDENLAKEGIPAEKIFLVGDIMVDSLLFHLDQAKKTNILSRLGLKQATTDRPVLRSFSEGGRGSEALTSDLRGSGALVSDLRSFSSSQLHALGSMLPFALMTLHRPANVDDKQALEKIVRGLLQVSAHFPILFPVHPRTAKQIKAFGMESSFQFHPSPDIRPEEYFESETLKKKIHCFDPLGYLDFLNLMSHAAVVLTDSGGIQEETTVLNIPCITLRDTTERPITLTDGTNVLVHNDPEKIVAEVRKVLDGQKRVTRCPSLWDGRTAERVIDILASHDAKRIRQD